MHNTFYELEIVKNALKPLFVIHFFLKPQFQMILEIQLN